MKLKAEVQLPLLSLSVPIDRPLIHPLSLSLSHRSLPLKRGPLKLFPPETHLDWKRLK
jgi:hypothetical protein